MIGYSTEFSTILGLLGLLGTAVHLEQLHSFYFVLLLNYFQEERNEFVKDRSRTQGKKRTKKNMKKKKKIEKIKNKKKTEKKEQCQRPPPGCLP